MFRDVVFTQEWLHFDVYALAAITLFPEGGNVHF